MPTIILFLVIITILVINAITVFMTNTKIKQLNKTLSHQYSLLVKMQNVLKSRSATNAVAENSEMIYQDLLQNLIPIMAAIDVMPRQTTEHPLWRAIGGIMDAYAANPFTLEKLRRALKLNPDVARNTDNYLARADRFLTHLQTSDPEGILGATFTDGLLGQSITFFGQAKQLAETN